MNIYLPENLVDTEAKLSALWMKVTCEMKVNEKKSCSFLTVFSVKQAIRKERKSLLLSDI